MNSSLWDACARIIVYAAFIGILTACKNGDTTSTPATSSPSNASSSTISVVDSGGNRLQEATVTLSTALN